MPQNIVTNTITHVTLNTINNVLHRRHVQLGQLPQNLKNQHTVMVRMQ